MYGWELYETEKRSEHRTFARDHSFGEWVDHKKDEAGEVDRRTLIPACYREFNSVRAGAVGELLRRIEDGKKMIALRSTSAEYAFEQVARQAERVTI